MAQVSQSHDAPEKAGKTGRAGQIIGIVFKCIAILAYIAAFSLLALAVFTPRDATFRVSARTEIVRIAIGGGPSPELAFPKARVLDMNDQVLAECDLAVTPGAGSELELRRYGVGPAFVALNLSAPGAEASVRCADGSAIAPQSIDVIQVTPASGERQAFLVQGFLTLGEVPREASARFAGIIDGEVSIAAKPLLPGPTEWINGQALLAGEQLTLRHANGEGATGYSTIFMDDDHGMQVVHQAVARNAKLSRYGGSKPVEVLIAPTYFDRLQTNFFWAILPLAFGLVSSSLSLLFPRKL